MALLALAGGLAAGVVWHPGAGIAVAASISVALTARCFPRLLERLFLSSLLGLLVCYALLGRTFAGVGVAPVYVGEVVLGVGLLCAVGTGWRLVRTPSVYLLIAFMCWGAVRTIPYLDTYGLNALRDGVVWGYGIFALLLAPVLMRRDLVDKIPAIYARVLPWIVVCAPAWVFVAEWTDLRGLPEAVKVPKPGDAAVHLAGAAAFLLAGVRAQRPPAGGGWFAEWGALAALLVVGVVAMGSLNRAGLVAFIAAILSVMMLLPFKAAGKLLLAGAMGALVATLWLGWGASLQVRDDRAVSPQQIASNLISIGGGPESESMEGTRLWRLRWWDAILGYTLHGKYFWTGKGFGLNLAYDDHFQPYPDSPNRSPHNGHLTILARAGVPGVILWAALQLGFALSMLAGFVRARQAGQYRRASLFAWILAYWLAFLVNASFDVALEGPQAGIWLWCIFAYGLALLAGQSHQVSLRPRAKPQPILSRAHTHLSSGSA